MKCISAPNKKNKNFESAKYIVVCAHVGNCHFRVFKMEKDAKKEQLFMRCEECNNLTKTTYKSETSIKHLCLPCNKKIPGWNPNLDKLFQ